MSAASGDGCNVVGQCTTVYTHVPAEDMHVLCVKYIVMVVHTMFGIVGYMGCIHMRAGDITLPQDLPAAAARLPSGKP